MRSTRRSVLRQGLASLAASCAGAVRLGLLADAVLASGCTSKPRTRQDVLRSLVLEVVLPSTQAVVQTSNVLGRALAALQANPNDETLNTSRSAWSDAVVAWKRARCFRNGPIVETNALLRATFWPVRAPALDSTLKSDAALNADFVGELGADVRGLYALERLLFPVADGGGLVSSETDRAARRFEFANELGRDLVRSASALDEAMADGEAYSRRFADGGQLSLSALVSQLSDAIESLSAHRIDLVLNLEQSHLLKPNEVEGWPSATSTLLARAEFQSAEALYRGGAGGGVRELIAEVAPEIAKRIDLALGECNAALGALDAPLERLVHGEREKLTNAAAKCKSLERAFKIDAAGALGVTLTFQAGDGD
jgi:predicted lipoprotein